MATVNGTSGNDELFGFSTADTINGFAGSDQIFGDAGDDLLLAGAGDDTVIGGEGNDSLTGDDGNDLLNASEGNDVLDGGLGNDALTGGTGNDTVTGGLGNDIAYYAGNQGDFKFALNAVGNVVITDVNTLDGDEGTDVLNGVETLQFADRSWQVTKLGEFLVNTTTTDSQQSPAITALTDGGFVVTWMSNLQDGSGYGIYGQRYNSSGVAAGTEFRINTTTFNEQQSPVITTLADGGFVVTWGSLQDGSGYGVYGQRYNSSGVAAGTEFLVNTRTTSDQHSPAITALADGGFVVTWMSYNQDSTSTFGIYGQRYNSSGVAAGTEFRINTTTTSNQQSPAITALGDGGFVVTWSGKGSGDLDGVFGQRYNSSSVVSGTEFRVNTTDGTVTNNTDQSSPAITALADGGFVVTWMSNGQDGSGYSIYGQRYNSSGVAAGTEFRINTTTGGDQFYPAITALSDGGFVVSWISRQDATNSYGIYGQRYNSSGVAAGTEFRINTTTAGDQIYPDVTALLDGGFIVTWMSDGQDGSNQGVYAQRFNANGQAILQGITGSAQADIMDLSTSVTAALLAGGAGDDTYKVGIKDVVVELANEGTDTIVTDVSYNLGANLENLTLTGASVIDGYGNGLNNNIIGNSANNILDGGSANDTISGGDGDDNIRGGFGNDLISGDAGNDTLIGGIGNDTLQGGIGSDTYTMSTGFGQDVIDDTQNGGTDLNTIGMISYTNSALNYTRVGKDYVIAAKTGTDQVTIKNFFDAANTTDYRLVLSSGTLTRTQLAALTITGVTQTGTTANDTLTGGDGDDTLNGLAGNDSLNGATGADTLVGGIGDDIYVVDNINDVVTEALNEGTDTVQSSISYILSSNLENLTLTGSAVIDGTGNTANNLIMGNTAVNMLTGGAGDDTLNGGTGNDSLIGGAGNDTYVVDVAGDVVTENANEGTDTVQSAVSYFLGANVENVTLTGSATIIGVGNALNNVMIGNSANNLLDAGAGDDTLTGGAGDDTYTVDSAGDVVTEALNEGTDTVLSLTSYTLTANVENLTLLGIGFINGTGNTLNNTIKGNDLDNALNGGVGNDTLTGGAGNDTYIVDAVGDVVVEVVNEGTDTVQSSVTYTLGTNLENLTLTGAAAINGTGNTVNNVLTGNAADNLLDGGTGSDSLTGGAGNDTYIVDVAGDVVTENANEGTDTVQSAIAYTLGANLENLTLTGAAAINGTGNAANNIIIGNSANNVLDGGAGNDALTGGAGNDTYVIDAIGDVITENVNEGTDSVQSSVTYTLSANLENLTLTGAAVINGTGNASNNLMTGNSANNALASGAGNDTLIGGAGNDSLTGGAGDDTYDVDSASDVVTEAVSEGTDTVQSSVTYTLGANLENLTLTGAAAINGIGNTSNNVITGNTADNVLNGNTGNDTLIGGAGNDTYVIDSTSDVITENTNEGTDLVQSSVTYTLTANLENLTLMGVSSINGIGNASNNILTGNTAENQLNGGAGNDTLIGGAGNDTYVVDSASDVITENANEGADSVQSSVTYILGANLENLTLTGATAINGTGNSLNNTLVGNSGNNILDGGVGNDTLTGGLGNDTYVIDAAGDVVTENANEGADGVQSSVTYTLGANLENLTLTGVTAINGTGNTLNNTITGNSGNNILTGGLSNDTLTGGAGSDTYRYSKGDGLDLIINTDSSVGRSDILQVSGLGFQDFTFSRTVNTLVVNAGATDSISIQDFYANAANQLDRIEYSNGVGVVDHVTGSIDFTSTDTANLLSWSSWHQVRNAQLQIVQDDIVMDNGSKSNLEYDVSNTKDWQSYRTGVDSAARTDWVQVLNDDGSFDQTDFDQASTESWTVRNDHKDNTGALDWIRIQNDNGTLDQTDFDQTNTQVWKEQNRHLDSQGRLDYIQTINDDTTVDWQDEDQDSSQTWATVNSHQLADGRLDWRRYINDNGTEDWLDLDQDNTQTWTEQNSRKDNLGRDDTRTVIWDNNTKDIIDVDQTNVEMWQQNTQHFNAAGAYLGSDVLLDAGIDGNEVWLRQVGNSLEVSQIGTTQKMTIVDWFVSAPSNQKTNFQLATGGTLLATEVQALVTAMASFAPPAVGQTSLTTAQHQALDGVIAANWS